MGFFTGRPETVDAALAPLLQAIADLENVNTECLQSSVFKKSAASQLLIDAHIDEKEAARAEGILTNLKTLVGVTDTEE